MKKIAIGGIAFLGALFLFLTVEHFRGKMGLARWKVRMAAKGFSSTLSEAAPRMLPSDNGMPALITATSNLVMLSYAFPEFTWQGTNKVVCVLKQETWLSKTKPKPRPTLSWKMVAEDLAAIEITLTNGLKAMDHPQFQAELDYTQGWQLPLRHLGPILRFIDLSVSALSELRQGHLDNAVRRMEAAIQCLGIFGNEPLWVSKVTQSYKAISVFDCTWQAVHANGLQDGHLQRLQDAWRKLDFISDVSRALVMESAIVRHEFARFRGTNQTVYEWLEGKSAPAAPSMAVTAVGRGNATKLVQWLQRRSLLARLEIQLVATG